MATFGTILLAAAAFLFLTMSASFNDGVWSPIGWIIGTIAACALTALAVKGANS